jgi:hypothetical protein
MLQVEERHTQRDQLNHWKDQMVIFDKAKLHSDYPSIDMSSHAQSRQQIEVLVHEEFKFDRYDQLGLPSGQQSQHRSSAISAVQSPLNNFDVIETFDTRNSP